MSYNIVQKLVWFCMFVCFWKKSLMLTKAAFISLQILEVKNSKIVKYINIVTL